MLTYKFQHHRRPRGQLGTEYYKLVGSCRVRKSHEMLEEGRIHELGG